MKQKIKIIAKVKEARVPKSPTVLINITIVFLLLFGFLAILLSDWIIASLEQGLGKVALNSSILINLGLSWIILAVLLHFTNKMVIHTKSKLWALFIIIESIVIGITGRLFSALLALMAGIIYLLKIKK